jgi:choline dehydrogenase-like flavoprotein
MPSNPTLSCDVLVCGGGIAGTMAAVAAARHGADVVLVERYGFLGGNATAGAVGQFNSWQTAAGRRIIAGLAEEVVDRLRTYGGAGQHEVFVMSNGHTMDRVPYAPEVLKLVLDDMVMDAGVRVLFHANLLAVECRARKVESVQLLTKSGVLEFAPRILIDASGDIDALNRAGVRLLSLDEGETLQPATMMFRFGPMDFVRFGAIPKPYLGELARRGFEKGDLARAALHASPDPFSQDGWFNISRLGIDATDSMSLSRAEIEGRKQAWRAAAYLRAAVPGCENGRLQAFATQVGVRETRRVEGDHVLTVDELLQSRPFADAIAAGAYPVDIHPAAGGDLVYKTFDADHAYQIPYRSLIPADLDNALAVGRGISATHEALAAIRVMTISMAVGQAGGTAAALASLETNGMSRLVPIGRLQEILQADGACLELAKA